MKLLQIVLTIVIFFSALSCKKEYSLEGQQTDFPIDSIECKSVSVHGNYIENIDLTDTDYVVCQVNIAKPGKYKTYSDTLNGFYFFDTGYTSISGKQNIVLKGYGHMQTSKPTNFILHFNNSICNFSVVPTQAEYTLLNSNINCEGMITPYGSYKAGQPLTIADSVVLQVNVATAGLYNIQTSVINGIDFTASGTLTHVGTQSIVMTAHGSPVSGGSFEYQVMAPNSTCSFVVNTDYKSIDTSMHYSFDADGKHYFGYLDSAAISAILTPSGTVSTISFGTLINVSADTLLNMILSRVDNNISLGVYHSAIISNEDYACGMDFSNKRGFIYYSSNNLPAFQVELLTYSKPAESVKGKFSGPILNDKEQLSQITNGTFQTYLSH